ncbi:Wzz/FepE/Etk N-terminal domain-containing protein [Mangrovihabitans endophyticus]|uniref:Wzz/FepE/Etk N-terminal domain-containing protein n=1 Tax=Mangrovihabitans endophyticus TaxID=1751298 RepID=UPI001E51B6EA|nr:Wzz/FepE/Etk N-terminal domain-containing protein [Mangrovihabitans endophyticus]
MSADLSHYLGMLRRHWWVVIAVTAAGLAAAAGFTSTVPKVYESSTAVLVQPVDQDANATGGRTKATINLDTEAQLVGSGAVATRAQQLLRSPRSPIDLARDVSVEVPPNTTVLMVRFSADTPEGAQAGSHAFAEAYLRNREDTARSGLDEQIKSLTLKVRQLTSNLAGINARLARSAPNSSTRSNLESLRSNSQNQLNSLTGRLNELTTTTVAAGSIISDARVPDAPTSPNLTLNLATGGVAGLLLGLTLAFARERLDRRLRTATDVRDRARIPVLASLDERTTPHFDDVLQPYGPGGRVFNRLRNEVLASMSTGDQIIVVTGASRGSASTLVATNLAAALARAGNDVVLIGAHLPDSVVDAAPLARMLGVAPTPGLSDLLAGRVGLANAMQRTPRIPSLRVITTGGAATAAGLMQSQRLRDTLQSLRKQAAYVIIEAPSTSSSADAQSLASLADAAIIAVELRRSRRPALVDAVEQLRRVGTPLLGSVVLPRLAGLRTDTPRPAAVTLPTPAKPDTADTAIIDTSRTQPMSVPKPAATRSGSGPATPRQTRTEGVDDATAVIDMKTEAASDEK